MTGGRLKKLQPLLINLFLNMARLSNVNIKKLLQFHKKK